MTGVPQVEIETIAEEDFSRRSFLQLGGACLAGGLLLPTLASSSFAAEATNTTLPERMWGVAMTYGGDVWI